MMGWRRAALVVRTALMLRAALVLETRERKGLQKRMRRTRKQNERKGPSKESLQKATFSGLPC